MSSADDAMTRYSAGEEDAFEEVYDVVAPRLENFLRRYLRQATQIEDIVQQTFLQMHQARGTFIAGAPVLPWAFAIARRLTIDAARRRQSHEHLEIAQDERFRLAELSANAASAEDVLAAREAGARLTSAYESLSEPQRVAFDLVTTEGLSHAEAACVLGTTVTGIKLRIHRVYLALRAAVKDQTAVATLTPVREQRWR